MTSVSAENLLAELGAVGVERLCGKLILLSKACLLCFVFSPNCSLVQLACSRFSVNVTDLLHLKALLE